MTRKWRSSLPFTALQPAAAGALLQDLALILGIFTALPRRLALLVDAPTAGHNADKSPALTKQSTTLSTRHSTKVSTRKHSIYFQNTLFLVSNNQGWIARRHCQYFQNHYLMHDTGWKFFVHRFGRVGVFLYSKRRHAASPVRLDMVIEINCPPVRCVSSRRIFIRPTDVRQRVQII